jgi:Phage integrase central domain
MALTTPQSETQNQLRSLISSTIRTVYLLKLPQMGGKWWRSNTALKEKTGSYRLALYPEVPLSKQERGALQLENYLLKTLREKCKVDKLKNKLSASNSFELVAREWWQSHMKNKTETHKQKVIRRFELYLFPWIGKKPISTITAPQVLEVIKRIEKLNILETTHRTLQAAGQVFRYAVQNGYTDRDVTADLKCAL